MTKCGYVAIIGRPNVGKSTLMNHLIGQKVSITCRKPQTTRHQVLGIVTHDDIQTVYVDTPGLHLNGPKAMNKLMNKSALTAFHDVDCICFVCEAQYWCEEDDWILKQLTHVDIPVIAVINKWDTLKEKDTMLEVIGRISKQYAFRDIVPISAKQGHQLDVLQSLIHNTLPEQDFIFPDDALTNRSTRFLVQEIIREKLMRQTGKELPYSLTVNIEHFKTHDDLTEISAVITVERDSQKAMIIGKGGQKLKCVGKAARLDIEVLLDQKVFLQLWVKVKSGWSDDEKALRQLGYGEDEA